MTDFPPDVVAAVCRHMNEDHPEDNLLIVRALGGVPDATEGTAVHVDGSGMGFDATTPDGAVQRVTVPFAAPAPDRPAIRVAVVELYDRACAVAGVTPRAH